MSHGYIEGPAPQLGADTAEVLDELGLGARSRLGLERILLPHAELPRGSIFRLPPRRVCR